MILTIDKLIISNKLSSWLLDELSTANVFIFTNVNSRYSNEYISCCLRKGNIKNIENSDIKLAPNSADVPSYFKKYNITGELGSQILAKVCDYNILYDKITDSYHPKLIFYENISPELLKVKLMS